MSKTTLPARRKRTDDIFFPAISIVIFGVVFYGFSQTYFLAGMVSAKLPNQLVHVHAAIFLSWILLLILQNVLVAIGKVRWHKTLGILGILLIPLMAVFGVLTLLDSIRRNTSGPPPVLLLVGDLEQLLLFLIFTIWALLVRGHAAAHKRLMTLGTMAILGPAISRFPFPEDIRLSATLALYLALPLVVVVYDLFTLERVHRATMIAAGTIIFATMTVISFAGTPFWQTVISWIRHT
jgi:hypothetical protein